MHYSELNYNSSRDIRSFLEQNSIRLQKRFGQNFLVDPHVRQAIVDQCLSRGGKTFWEIGPGIGSLTQELIRHADRVTVFEIDYGIIKLLEGLFAGENLEVVSGDCVETLPMYIAEHSVPDVIVGNLPYNAAGAILMSILEGGYLPDTLITMVQRESALRMAAAPGSKDYSAYSVACQARSEIRICFDVAPDSFFPRPEVVSSVVKLSPLRINHDLPPWFSSLVRSAFSSRRKTLRNNMKGIQLYPGVSGEMVLDACSDLGIEPGIRAEKISVEEFIALAGSLSPQEPLSE